MPVLTWLAGNVARQSAAAACDRNFRAERCDGERSSLARSPLRAAKGREPPPQGAASETIRFGRKLVYRKVAFHGILPHMDMVPWLSPVLELAELLLELGQRDDVERTLHRLDAEEISLEEALEKLRHLRLHRSATRRHRLAGRATAGQHGVSDGTF